nr:structural maintenance of chromosomes protein 4 [Tanacetum cinerariifolium]
MFFLHQDIDKNSTEISRHEVQNETDDTRTNELRHEIEKSKKEKDRVIAREKILVSTLTEINQRILKLIDQHKGVLGKAKSDYETLKKTINELQAYEVLLEAQMLERVALLEAQMEKMNPNLNSGL